MEKLGALPGPSSVRSVCTVIFLCPADELEFYKNGVTFPRRFLLLWLNSILQSLRYILWFLTQPETQPQGRESHCRNPALGSFLFFLSVPLSFQRRFKYPHRVDKNKQINKKKNLLHHPGFFSTFRFICFKCFCSEFPMFALDTQIMFLKLLLLIYLWWILYSKTYFCLNGWGQKKVNTHTHTCTHMRNFE